MISISFFNNAGGVGKTTLVYHTAWMFSKLGYRVLVVDLDPKSILSVRALGEERLDELWNDAVQRRTLYGAVLPLFEGTGDIEPAHTEALSENLGLLVGDVRLARLDEGEGGIAVQWARCLAGDKRALRVVTAFGRVIREAAQRHKADFVLVDMDSGLGSFNRAALLAASHIVVPCMLNIPSIRGMKNLVPVLHQWRQAWQMALTKAPAALGELPQGRMEPIGYVMTHFLSLELLGESSLDFIKQFSIAYRERILGVSGVEDITKTNHPDLLEVVNHHNVVMSMAIEARKPVFDLTPEDELDERDMLEVQRYHEHFNQLCNAIAQRVGVEASQGAAKSASDNVDMENDVQP